MSKFVAVTFGWVLSIAVGIWVMMAGWGLEPESWWVIIGGGVFMRLMVEVMTAISKETA